MYRASRLPLDSGVFAGGDAQVYAVDIGPLRVGAVAAGDVLRRENFVGRACDKAAGAVKHQRDVGVLYRQINFMHHNDNRLVLLLLEAL